MIDRAFERVFFEFVKHFKPTIRFHGGDYADLRPLRQGAGLDEQQGGVEDDVDSAVSFMRRFKPTHVLDGNHDYRLFRATQGKDEKLAEFAARLIVDLNDAMGAAKRYPWDKRDGVMRLGDTNVLHGYFGGVYAARQTAAVYGKSLAGHVHTIDEARAAGLDDRVARICGCGCRVNMDYNRGQVNTLRQRNGFPYGLVFANGETLTWQAQQMPDGRWLMPSEFSEYGKRKTSAELLGLA